MFHYVEQPNRGNIEKNFFMEVRLSAKFISGNEALIYGALRVGVKVVTGYPGTPSSRAIATLLAMDLPDRYVEWSTNEKVALEIATGAAWSGQRAMCTMKMSGLNVAYDSLISIAYSGTVGGLVIYVADDPGVSAGMAEQDSRGFAYMSDLPMLEPSSVAEAYELTKLAFELSEKAGTPVFIRLVTSLANSRSIVQLDDPLPPPDRKPVLIRDIPRFTKAGSAICMTQHRDLISRLIKARDFIEESGVNTMRLSNQMGGLGIVASGVTASYVEEGLQALGDELDISQVSILKIVSTNPYPAIETKKMLAHCSTIIILEELEGYIEDRLINQAYQDRLQRRIIGKSDGTFTRIGEYTTAHVIKGLQVALGKEVVIESNESIQQAESLCAARPITMCAGCPHRGTFMAINAAIRKLHYKKDEVMVTGDIGCTILGMNPPFNTVWNEISMGASIALAQGFVRGGIKTPVIATMGDSTFFHAGMPGLVNAVQHRVPLTLIILDNGWTAMTGMQANPGTQPDLHQVKTRHVDIARIVQAMGIDHFFLMDPNDLSESTSMMVEAISKEGVKVVLSRRECAIQSKRRGVTDGKVIVFQEQCTLCKLCITMTGCPALKIENGRLSVDESLCNGCGLCADTCKLDAIRMEA
jgi:indolepyruvate ferredoxin oxidoreductase alpha subunit